MVTHPAHRIPLILIGLGILLLAGGLLFSTPTNPDPSHTHADFKLYINDVSFDFSQEKYMSHEDSALSKYAHLHGGDGGVLHMHAPGVTLELFFESLGLRWSGACMELEDQTICNTEESTWRLFVNGVEKTALQKYQPADLDQILITYGNADSQVLQAQLNSISDNACIQSQTCPWRGEPTDKGCVSGGECIGIIPELLEN